MVIFLVCVLIYGVSIFGGFIQDDRKVILADPTLGKIESLLEAWISPYYKGNPESGAYRPLTSFSLALDSIILGKSAWGYRMMNIIFYGLVCIGVYELSRRVFRSDKWGFWVGLLFVVLPIHTEAVSNIVGRGELLAGGLVIWMLVMAMEKKWGWSMLLYFLAILSKESAVVWVVPLVWLIFQGKLQKDKLWGIVMIVAMGLVAYFMFRLAILGSNIFSDNATLVENPLKFVGHSQRVVAGIGLVAYGINKTLFPIQLSYDYSFDQLGGGNLSKAWLMIGLGVILLSIFLMRKRKAELSWGLLFLWLPLIVTGNIIKPIGTIFGERLWLLPSLGVLYICVWLITQIKFRWIELVLWLVVVLLGVRSFVRNIDWLGENRLFVKDGAYATGSVLTQSNVAAVYLMEGRPDEARIYLEKASSIYPEYPYLMNNWGIYYWQKEDLKSAKEMLEKCIEVHPQNALCTGNLGDLERVDAQIKTL